MGQILDDRRTSSEQQLDQFKQQLGKAQEIAAKKACVYATGSFGRNEASPHSDLDLFIVGENDPDQKSTSAPPRPALRNLDAICLKAELIGATKAVDLPEFDGDGRWLEQYTVDDLVRTLGEPEDDAANTFTARLLLLLESRPILGQDVYEECIDRVISKYWRDYEDRKDEFMPAFLANDILRLWRTFCINYEARTETDPPRQKAKRKLKNYKLKHSRLLTCYSALAFMLVQYQLKGTFHPEEARDMVALSPTARLEALVDEPAIQSAHSSAQTVLDRYEHFLDVTNRATDDLVGDFMDKSTAARRYDDAVQLGDEMFKLLSDLGSGSPFYRLMVV